jgi:hypothetical protein
MRIPNQSASQIRTISNMIWDDSIGINPLQVFSTVLPIERSNFDICYQTCRSYGGGRVGCFFSCLSWIGTFAD